MDRQVDNPASAYPSGYGIPTPVFCGRAIMGLAMHRAAWIERNSGGRLALSHGGGIGNQRSVLRRLLATLAGPAMVSADTVQTGQRHYARNGAVIGISSGKPRDV
jgi:hypothetical protein